MPQTEPAAAEVVPMLPGLDGLADRRGSGTVALERIALEHVQALADAGRIGAGDRLLVALIIDLARAVGMSSAYGKAAGAAMAARQLLDAMDKLPPLVEEGGADEWAAVVAALAPPSA